MESGAEEATTTDTFSGFLPAEIAGDLEALDALDPAVDPEIDLDGDETDWNQDSGEYVREQNAKTAKSSQESSQESWSQSGALADPERDTRCTYTKILRKYFGVRGPPHMLAEGDEITVWTLAGKSRTELVGRKHAEYPASGPDGIAVYYLVRPRPAPIDRVTYMNLEDRVVLRGPESLLGIGSFAEVVKRDGNIRVEQVGERVDLEGSGLRLAQGVFLHEIVREDFGNSGAS